MATSPAGRPASGICMYCRAVIEARAGRPPVWVCVDPERESPARPRCVPGGGLRSPAAPAAAGDEFLEAWLMTTTDLTLLRRAAEALIDIGKKALVVKTTLNKPYPDAPSETPWSRYMEQPARRAYNLGHEIRRAVLALAETPDQVPEVDRAELAAVAHGERPGNLIEQLRQLPSPHQAVEDAVDRILARYHITPRETNNA